MIMKQQEKKLREMFLEHTSLLINENKPDKDYHKINAIEKYKTIQKNEYIFRQYIAII
jgi:hypothetical protein